MSGSRKTDWMQDAACRGLPTSWWFGDGTAKAKAICASCPVQDECAVYLSSLPAPQAKYGIWAGKSPRQRRGTRRVGRPVSATAGTKVALPVRSGNNGPGPAHGKWVAYTKYGCRCVECVEHMRAHWREMIHRRRERGSAA